MTDIVELLKREAELQFAARKALFQGSGEFPLTIEGTLPWKAAAEIASLREALKNLLDHHGAYIEALPGERGLTDLAEARALLPTPPSDARKKEERE